MWFGNVIFMIIWHCRSQLKNVDSSGIWTRSFGIAVRRSACLSYRVHRDWKRVFIQLKCTRYSCDNLTLIHERMFSVSILFQNHLQRYTWTEFFNYNHFSVDFGSVRLSWKIIVHLYLWGWFGNVILIVHFVCDFLL